MYSLAYMIPGLTFLTHLYLDQCSSGESNDLTNKSLRGFDIFKHVELSSELWSPLKHFFGFCQQEV